MSEVEIRGQGRVSVANVICLGRTYRKHAIELGNAPPVEPLVFLKSSRCVRPLAEGPLAFPDETFHHEAEVVLCLDEHAGVSAVGLGLDLTRRGVQDALKLAGHPWTTAKSFTGAALVGPLAPAGSVGSLDAIELSLTVEGEPRQAGSTAQLTWPVASLLEHLASFMPLGEGDLVFTGTPEGVAEIRRGDRFVLESPQLGRFEGAL